MNLKQYKDPEEILEWRNAHGYVLKAGFTIVRVATCLQEAALSSFHLVCPSARLGRLERTGCRFQACVDDSVPLCSSLPCTASGSEFPEIFSLMLVIDPTTCFPSFLLWCFPEVLRYKGRCVCSKYPEHFRCALVFSGSVSRLPVTSSESSCQPHPHLNLLNNYFGSSFSSFFSPLMWTL